jgi:5-methylcytosine-specific restriction protein A
MLGATLQNVARNYPSAIREPFGGHSLARFIRDDTVGRLGEAVGPDAAGLKLEGSPGRGKWADVPWLAVFDPVVTTSATKGYYVVYLFAADMASVALSLNQGTTAVRQEFGARAREVLRDRAALMRARLPEHVERFSPAPIGLASRGALPGDYEAGHAFGRVYMLASLPSDEEMAADLREMVGLYLALTFRGGLDPTPEAEGSEEQGAAGAEAIVELRRYRYHRRIERASTIAVKRIHGHRCQACDLDFEERYGPLGHGYIEAHHLIPLSELPEGKPVSLDPVKDFAVLCANCHRMMHRSGAPDRVEALCLLIRSDAVA